MSDQEASTSGPSESVDLWALSERLEDETAYDSIATIVAMYGPRMNAKPYSCPFPMCEFVTNDEIKMWRHAHFSRKHKLSFGVPWSKVETLDKGTGEA